MTIQFIKNQIVKGIKKYCQENHFKDVVLGLSGGLDSAVVLALACEAIGSEHVHTVMMKTKYTSQQSLDLAKKAAQMNHVDHTEIDIQPIVDVYLKTLPFSIQNDITLQNLQARVRGVLLMTYSNDNRWLLLSCGNKSEAAMGYCTLYGDTCGGISPIGDVFKTDVYKLAHLYNQEGSFFVPQGIINRAPTAELAPDQKDTDSLPPYSILDQILKDYIFGTIPIPQEKQQEVSLIQQRYTAMAFKRKQIPQAIRIIKD